MKVLDAALSDPRMLEFMRKVANLTTPQDGCADQAARDAAQDAFTIDQAFEDAECLHNLIDEARTTLGLPPGWFPT